MPVADVTREGNVPLAVAGPLRTRAPALAVTAAHVPRVSPWATLRRLVHPLGDAARRPDRN